MLFWWILYSRCQAKWRHLQTNLWQKSGMHMVHTTQVFICMNCLLICEFVHVYEMFIYVRLLQFRIGPFYGTLAVFKVVKQIVWIVDPGVDGLKHLWLTPNYSTDLSTHRFFRRRRREFFKVIATQLIEAW